MIKYSVAMGIRFVCILSMLFVQGWWLAVCVVGAVFLPYFAVVIANVPARTRNRVSVGFRPNELPQSREDQP